jgi:hypothetical protein
MTALPTATPTSDVATPPASRSAGILVTRVLLLVEAALTLGLSIFLSLLASALGDFSGPDAELTVRWASAAAFLFAIAAAIASRGVRRRRGWAWTTAAVLQLIMAVGTGIAVLNVNWHPAYLIGFALPALAMLVLCTPSVRRELGQE